MSLPSTGEPGTTVTAFLSADEQLEVNEARRYIADFVSLLEVPVYVNRTRESGRGAGDIVPLPPASWRGRSHETAGRLGAHVDLAVTQNGAVWVQLDSITWSGRKIQRLHDAAKRRVWAAHVQARIWAWRRWAP